MWLRKRRVITLAQVPEFPQINFELGWRQIIDPETQQAIINEVYQISHKVNIKIWLGIKWLSVYIALRPGEMLNLQEKHIDPNIGALVIPHPKEKTPKIIPLLDDDIEVLRGMPRGLPELYFFRHNPGVRWSEQRRQFGVGDRCA